MFTRCEVSVLCDSGEERERESNIKVIIRIRVIKIISLIRMVVDQT